MFPSPTGGALSDTSSNVMGFTEDRAQSKFGPYYLLVAENPYVLWEAIEQWKATWKRVDSTIHVQSFTAPNIDFDELLAAGSTIPMFETIQPVVIHDVDRLTGKKLDEFVRIVKQSSPATKWLLTSEGFDKRTAQYKAISSLGPVEEFPRIYADKMSGWIQRIASDFEAVLAPDAMNMIAAVHGSDLFAARQTIERAVLFIGRKRRIELEDVESVMVGEGEYDVFQLLEAASRNDFARTLAMARSLYAAAREDRDIPFWLSMMYGQCLRYLQMLEYDGKSNEQVGQVLHLHPFVVGKLRAQASGFGYDRLLEIITAAFETERALKTSTLTPKMAWELFVWRLSTRKKREAHSILSLESVRTWE